MHVVFAANDTVQHEIASEEILSADAAHTHADGSFQSTIISTSKYSKIMHTFSECECYVREKICIVCG